MKPTVTVLASGLNLLSFQGVTTFQNSIFVATVDADLMRVARDGTWTPWVNVARYGIPSGIAGFQEGIMVALSAQELGHFLIQVTPQGKILPLTDLSTLAGEFGAPFAVAAHEGYYPWYLVALSTDVIRSRGSIVRVTRSGRTSVLATLPSTAFGVGIGESYAIATQENGQVVRIAFTGEIHPITNFTETPFGIPRDVTPLGEDWILTTSEGWLISLKQDGTLSPLTNLAEFGQGLPTTLTTFQAQLIVATQSGNLLEVVL